MASVWESERNPWNDPVEVLVWVLILAVATLFIHNSLRTYRKHRGTE